MYRLRGLLSITLILLSGEGKVSGQDAVYVGAAACGKCHAGRFAAQSSSPHAHALSPVAQHPAARFFVPEKELLRPPRFHFQFRHDGQDTWVRVSDWQESLDLRIDWAFGAGQQAVTFVSRLDEDWYLEHYFSYYSAIRSLAPSPGHEGYRSYSVRLASGIAYKSVDNVSGIVKCFECHSTGPPRIEKNREIRPAEPGVRCEACHGAGSMHIRAASQGRLTLARNLIQNPKRLPASGINQFCGRCHRDPQDKGLTDLERPWNVRHQPIYLNQSACFQSSNGSLSCLTCHDMHQPRRPVAADYDAKCAACHKSVKHTVRSGYSTTQPAGCIACHMPRVSPQAHLTFTNHWIGVYEDSNLSPRRSRTTMPYRR